MTILRELIDMALYAEDNAEPDTAFERDAITLRRTVSALRAAQSMAEVISASGPGAPRPAQEACAEFLGIINKEPSVE